MEIFITCLSAQPVPAVNKTWINPSDPNVEIPYQIWPTLFQVDVTGVGTPDAPGFAYVFAAEGHRHLGFTVIDRDGSYQFLANQNHSGTYNAVAILRAVINGAQAPEVTSDPISVENAA